MAKALTNFSDSDLLLKSLSDAVIMLDKDGEIRYGNPALLTLTGYAMTELLNKPLYLLYNDTNDQTKGEYDLSVARKRGSFRFEGWITRKDGTKLWGEITLSSILDNNQKVIGYTTILRDTTQRKEVELELRQSEERFRLMVEGVRDYSIFLLSPSGHIMTWNEGARKMKGYLPNEIIGKHLSIFYTSEDVESGKHDLEIKTAIQTGKYEEEGWRVRKNGSVFWANIVLTALYDEQNKLIGFSKVTRDLTERKEYEESLRQSEERYRLLVEQVTDYGIFMMDEKGRIVSWNEGARKIKGYTADEIIGKYFSIFYPQEDIINGKPAMELRVAQKEGKYEEEGWRLRKDGRRFWANVVITAVYNHNNNLIGFSKVTRDLTERKENERALRESYDRARLLADELKIANEELSLANRELEQFTSIASHDLQEPVRTIKSFLQLIDLKLDKAQTDELKAYIGKTIDAANKMRELIQNLLQYSQLSKTEITRTDVKVDDIIGEALQNIHISVGTANARITVENEVDYVKGDRIQLVQLLQNLLSNAVKFTNSTNPEVWIRCKEINGHAQFSISDNGIGIEKADVKKLFEIFRRLHTEKEYPGTGIGLAICKKIVDRHRGHIWTESEKGKGTTFYFTLGEENIESAHINE